VATALARVAMNFFVFSQNTLSLPDSSKKTPPFHNHVSNSQKAQKHHENTTKTQKNLTKTTQNLFFKKINDDISMF